MTEARRCGSYELLELIGRGGMGEVWRARHSLLTRPAAIKLIRTGGHEEDAAGDLRHSSRRFELEAQATAAMRSPHTIQLFDFGVTHDGTFYYVMELLDGLDLQTLVRRYGPVPAGRAVHLLQQVCHSLGEAHARGLIHRDVKPANIFTCRYGREVDFVKVLDFGIAKPRRITGDSGSLTQGGLVGGTPEFMSPEQVLGDRPLDQRADIYALGAVAYWLLTGKMVFEGENAMQVMLHHLQSEPAPPSSRTELSVPAQLDAVVLACLAKDPLRRPQTADDLAARLAGCASGNAWTTAAAREWWDLHLPASADGLAL
jgi:serine/threonine protein kinase